jgi:hypothetical protein
MSPLQINVTFPIVFGKSEVKRHKTRLFRFRSAPCIISNLKLCTFIDIVQSRTEKIGQVLLRNLAKIELGKPGFLNM